jgi:NAD(P) transhydrogenase subunit alpha
MKPGSVISGPGGRRRRQHAFIQARPSGRSAWRHHHGPQQPAGRAVRGCVIAFYARNLFNFVSLIVDKKSGALNIDWNDEIVKGSAVTRDGAAVARG